MGTGMSTIARLFGKSPFTILQKHMEKVGFCLDKLYPLFDAWFKGDVAAVEKQMKEVCRVEHECDIIKDEIRNHLPLAIFLPIPRASLLEILSLQDGLADKGEDVAVLLTFKNLEVPSSLHSLVKKFLEKNLETFAEVRFIIMEFDNLLESSFAGKEASVVAKCALKVAMLEHEADLIQRDLVKAIIACSESMHVSSFYLWMKVVQELGGISNLSEKLANRVRMTLEFK